MYKIFFLCLVFVTFQEVTAITISGKVVVDNTDRPLDAASVFFNNTTLGTLTNAQGEFNLNIPEGHYKLIVTYIGYNTYAQDVDVSLTSTNYFIINLIPKTYSISEIIVSASAKDWQINYDCFKKVFLGTTPNAADCKILNPHSIIFYRNKELRRLEAYSDTFILVENKALGYLVKFKLEFFASDFYESSYYGYPLFIDVSKVSSERDAILNRREEAYEGSVMHLLRSFYFQTTEKEGFACKKILEVTVDTTKYYPHTIMTNPLLLKKTRGTKLIQTEDTLKMADFITDTIENIKVLHYSEPFEVSYKKKEIMAYAENRSLYSGIKGRRKRQTSVLFIKSYVGLFDNNGVYLKGNDLMLAGYMSWKRVADMLPDNYEKPPISAK